MIYLLSEAENDGMASVIAASNASVWALLYILKRRWFIATITVGYEATAPQWYNQQEINWYPVNKMLVKFYSK